MKVRDAISNEPVWVNSSATIAEVAHVMQESDCAFIPVIEDRHPVGVVTDRDIAMALALKGFNPNNTAIRNVMSPEPDCVDADAPLEEAANAIIAKGVHRLVVDKAGVFVGVISIADLAGLIADSRVSQTLRMLADHNHPHFIHHEKRAIPSQSLLNG